MRFRRRFSTEGILPGLVASSVVFFIWAHVSLRPGASELLALGFPVLYSGLAAALSWRSPSPNWGGSLGMFGGIFIGYSSFVATIPDPDPEAGVGLFVAFVILAVPILLGIHAGKYR